jgi:FkbM family methyltransferase
VRIQNLLADEHIKGWGKAKFRIDSDERSVMMVPTFPACFEAPRAEPGTLRCRCGRDSSNGAPCKNHSTAMTSSRLLRSGYLKPTIAQRILRVVGQLPIPNMKSIYRRIGVLRDTTARHFTVRLGELKYKGCLDQHVDRHIYYLGAYSPAELDFLGRAAAILRNQQSTLTFVDIGANVGQHSLFMACRADRIVAFEPNGEVADQLEANLRLNGLNNVEVLRYALGREEETGELGSGHDGNSGSRSLLWSLDKTKNTTVQIRQADRAMTELSVKRVDLIKIDVEGYEKNVLAGLVETLRRDRPVILFELGPKAKIFGSADVKGGFRSETELRAALYDDHCLFTLVGARKASLAAFDWGCDEAVCMPRQLAKLFKSLMKPNTR